MPMRRCTDVHVRACRHTSRASRRARALRLFRAPSAARASAAALYHVHMHACMHAPSRRERRPPRRRAALDTPLPSNAAAMRGRTAAMRSRALAERWRSVGTHRRPRRRRPHPPRRACRAHRYAACRAACLPHTHTCMHMHMHMPILHVHAARLPSTAAVRLHRACALPIRGRRTVVFAVERGARCRVCRIGWDAPRAGAVPVDRARSFASSCARRVSQRCFPVDPRLGRGL